MPARALPFAAYSFRALLAEFLKAREAQRCTPATLKFYQFALAPFAEWCEARHIAPASLGASNVDDFLLERAGQGVSDSTLHAHARSVRAMMRFAEERGLIDHAPRLRMPRVPKPRPSVLSVDDFRRLLGACRGVRDRALLLLLADSGLRRAEAAALRWRDMDLASGRLRVVSGKGRKDRLAVVGPVTRAALRELQELRGDGASQPVFGLTAWGVGEAAKRLAKRAGTRVSPHALRRFFAVGWLRNGGDLRSLQILLGHQSIVTTERYLALADDDLVAAHERHSPVESLNRSGEAPWR